VAAQVLPTGAGLDLMRSYEPSCDIRHRMCGYIDVGKATIINDAGLVIVQHHLARPVEDA
jgi:hypothetical protein